MEQARRRQERFDRRQKQRMELLNKWFKEMSYLDIKKVLIRLKSRKFLVTQCTICLEPI